MKIIFDTDNQKRTLMHLLSDSRCPRDFGLAAPGGYCSLKDGCELCWKSSDLEMEVKNE